MKNYDRINALPPEGIERNRAHIVGGGIAGLASAVFLVDDAHMPGESRVDGLLKRTTRFGLDAVGARPLRHSGQPAIKFRHSGAPDRAENRLRWALEAAMRRRARWLRDSPNRLHSGIRSTSETSPLATDGLPKS
jgi:MCRA family